MEPHGGVDGHDDGGGRAGVDGDVEQLRQLQGVNFVTASQIGESVEHRVGDVTG